MASETVPGRICGPWGLSSPRKRPSKNETLIKPFEEKCASLGIELSPNATHYDSFYPAYKATFGTFNYYIGGAVGIPSNRLVPSNNWENPKIREKAFAAVQNALDGPGMINMDH